MAGGGGNGCYNDVIVSPTLVTVGEGGRRPQPYVRVRAGVRVYCRI